jgi:predicted esterase
MSKLAFEYQIENQNKIRQKPSLLLMHGYGSNEEDLFSFSENYLRNIM